MAQNFRELINTYRIIKILGILIAFFIFFLIYYHYDIDLIKSKLQILNDRFVFYMYTYIFIYIVQASVGILLSDAIYL